MKAQGMQESVSGQLKKKYLPGRETSLFVALNGTLRNKYHKGTMAYLNSGWIS